MRVGMKRGYVAVFTVLMIGQWAPTATAATIHKTPDPTMGCFVELRGTIEEGDAKKLAPLLRENWQKLSSSAEYHDGNRIFSQEKGRVCLNSPGGSFVGGLALAQLFQEAGVGTAVARGKTCFSACAVAFMGGVVYYENDVAPQPDRILHPTGQLGFHAPDLGVPAGQYNEKAVKLSYQIALKGVSSLLEIAPEIGFNNSLSTTMLATPATEMYVISNVGEAARWRVTIAPIAEPAKLTAEGLGRSCGYIDAADLDYQPEKLDGKPTNVTITQPKIGKFDGEMSDGFRQELATGCDVIYRTVAAGKPGRTIPSGWGFITGGAVHTWAYQTYAPDTPITSLALANDGLIEHRGYVVKTSNDQRSGRCLVVNGTRLVDNDPCQRMSKSTSGEDVKFRNIDRYIWPSGATTVLETVQQANGDMSAKLNGVPTARDWDLERNWKLGIGKTGVVSKEMRAALAKFKASQGDKDVFLSCWPNPSSGNRFCFLTSS